MIKMKSICLGCILMVSVFMIFSLANAADLQKIRSPQGTTNPTITPIKPPVTTQPGIMQPASQTNPQLVEAAKRQIQISVQTTIQTKIATLQSAENAKALSRVQSLTSQIKSRSLAVKAICTGSSIKSVFPSEVFPGDPVLIEGCGFGTEEGMVLLTEYGKKLDITSWSDTAINAVLPGGSVLQGFAEPKNISVKVSTVKGAVIGSQSILLRPAIGVEYISARQMIFGGVTSQCVAEQYQDLAIHRSYSENILCKGTDTFSFSPNGLKNNWFIKEIIFYDHCLESGNCSGSYYVATPANLNNYIGSKTLPSLSFDWKFTTSKELAGFYSHVGTALAGPMGTSWK